MQISRRRLAWRPVTAASGRGLAGLVALAAFVTLGLKLGLTMDGRGTGPAGALWEMYRSFAVITHTAVGIVAAMVAMGARPGAQVQAALLLAVGAVAVVHHVPVASPVPLPGLEAVVDEMLHTVLPALFALYWIGFAAKDGLRYRLVPFWLTYPLAYCAYVVLRGEIDGIYPYPFLDIGAEGAVSVSFNVLGLLLGLWLAGLAIVAIGRLGGGFARS